MCEVCVFVVCVFCLVEDSEFIEKLGRYEWYDCKESESFLCERVVNGLLGVGQACMQY